MTQISSERIASIEARKHELAEAMAAPNLSPDEFIRLSKDYAAIEPVAAAAREVRRLRAERESLLSMTRDADEELRQIASEELFDIEAKLPEAERALAIKLLPRDAADERAAMLEVRAGTGGDEALPTSAATRKRSRRSAVRGSSRSSNSKAASTASSACPQPKAAAASTHQRRR